MLPVNRDLEGPMRKQNSILLKCRSVALSMSPLAAFGYAVFHAASFAAENLQTAYQQAASTSRVIAQARAQA